MRLVSILLLLFRDCVHPGGQFKGGRGCFAESRHCLPEANRGIQAHGVGRLLNGLCIFWMPSHPLEELIRFLH